jgi:hypothetical protein
MALQKDRNPLDEALDQFTTSKNRDVVLKIVHAVLSATWTASTLANSEKSDLSAEAQSAESKVYARAIRSIENKMQTPFSPMTKGKAVVYTSGTEPAKK